MKYFINRNEYKIDKNIDFIISTHAEANGYSETNYPQEANVAFSIGGDGTFIDTAKIVSPSTDIIGINLGTLGYLTEVEPCNVEAALEAYFRGNYIIEKRSMLDGSVSKNDEIFCSGHALNDIVMSKDGTSVIDAQINVDGTDIARYYCDGIIISTPTGSTGYAFSCGAPIIDPTSEMIIVTPIAPHSIMNRSIIVSGNSKVSVKLCGARGSNKAKVAFDGEESEIYVGSLVTVEKFDSYARVVKFSKTSFLDRVMQKMK